ncbi:hypothetical protein BDV37DRAFT_50371 [Aspergillus pseudonomiae]|uniref:Uncharacterized protein n=1 Tax=Aspergillus pseudonomiae TaxID=1506151 RepID=A0A5N7CU46_9EURO|nr:uncharacterized protein BDV37DRAFT_50371 [Aspergillus pseudonomiae]KAE8397692.1 hypothetical protein BDV37DRAFT_50371 [Aspergillus pseudonomiae]
MFTLNRVYATTLEVRKLRAASLPLSLPLWRPTLRYINSFVDDNGKVNPVRHVRVSFCSNSWKGLSPLDFPLCGYAKGTISNPPASSESPCSVGMRRKHYPPIFTSQYRSTSRPY